MHTKRKASFLKQKDRKAARQKKVNQLSEIKGRLVSCIFLILVVASILVACINTALIQQEKAIQAEGFPINLEEASSQDAYLTLQSMPEAQSYDLLLAVAVSYTHLTLPTTSRV